MANVKATATWTRLERDYSPMGNAGFQWATWEGITHKELRKIDKLVTPWRDDEPQRRQMQLPDACVAVAERERVDSDDTNDLSRRGGIYLAKVVIYG